MTSAIPQAVVAALDIVVFTAGGYRIGVEASQVRASHPMPPEGGATPTEFLLGLHAAAATGGEQVLVVKHAGADREVVVQGPVELHSVAATAIHPLPPLVAARTQLRGLRALALERQRLTLLVDLRSLLGAC